MTIFTVVTTFGNGLFGSYTSLLRARKSIEYFLSEAADIISFEDNGDYSYQYTTDKGETFRMEICYDVLDYEFIEGICKEDE